MTQSLAGYWCHHKTNKAGSTELRGWSDKEIGAFFDHFVDIQPTTSLFHEIHEWAVEAKKRVPSCNVIFRRYIDPARYGVSEGDIWLKWTVQQHLDFFMPDYRPGLILNMWNEPGPEPVQLEGFAKRGAAVMDAFGAQNAPLAMIGWGVGWPNEGDDTIDRLEPLWDAYDRWYDLHIASHHEYGTHRGMLYHAEGSDFNVYPFRVGRAVDLIHPKVVARKSGVTGKNHKGFRVAFTEYGSDYAFDGQGGKRGYRDYWGGSQFGQEVVGSIVKTKRAFVIGYCVYKIGNSAGWGDFDVLGDDDFRKQITAGAKDGRLAPVQVVQPPPVPPTNPPPPVVTPPTYPQLPSADDDRWQRVIAAPRGGVVSVRAVPDKGGTVLTKIETVCEISMLGEETHGIWVPVLVPVEGAVPIIGWVTTDVITFLDVPDEVTEPVIELTAKHAKFLAEQYESMAASHASIAESEATIAKSNKEMAEFYRKIAGQIPVEEGQSSTTHSQS